MSSDPAGAADGRGILARNVNSGTDNELKGIDSDVIMFIVPRVSEDVRKSCTPLFGFTEIEMVRTIVLILSMIVLIPSSH